MAINQKRLSANAKYIKWCRKIAEKNNEKEIISHFRNHAYGHFDRHKYEGELGLRIWMIGVFNFVNIFREKYLKITTEDMLFKLCSYYKDHKRGPKPFLNIDKFMKEYKGDVKNYYYKYQAK
ncbi:MAG: hypothetical protein AAB361_02955 [Patescibacteria group bacterium]